MLHAIVNSLIWRIVQALLGFLMLPLTLWLWYTQGHSTIFVVLHLASLLYVSVALRTVR